MEDIKKNEATQIVSMGDGLKSKYGKVYRVGATIDVDREDGRIFFQETLDWEL